MHNESLYITTTFNYYYIYTSRLSWNIEKTRIYEYVSIEVN